MDEIRQTKLWLARALNTGGEVRALIAAKARAASEAEGTAVTTGRHDVDRKVQGGELPEEKQDRRQQALHRLSDMLDERIALLWEEQAQTLSVIGRVEDTRLRELLTQRYINGLTWEKVAIEMHYSYKHVTHELHPKALREAALARRDGKM